MLPSRLLFLGYPTCANLLKTIDGKCISHFSAATYPQIRNILDKTVPAPVSNKASETTCTTSTETRRHAGPSTVRKFSSGANSSIGAHFDKFRDLSLVKVQLSRILHHSEYLPIGDGISNSEFDVLSLGPEKLLTIEFQRGPSSANTEIKVFHPTDLETVVAGMYFDPDVRLKQTTLNIEVPLGRLYSTMYLAKGISPVLIVEDHRRNPLIVLHTDGGYGWTRFAKILTPVGDKVLGLMIVSDPVKNQLEFTLQFPADFETGLKLTLIGAALVLFAP